MSHSKMTEDLVNELRFKRGFGPEDFELLKKAADEIERLSGLLDSATSISSASDAPTATNSGFDTIRFGDLLDAYAVADSEMEQGLHVTGTKKETARRNIVNHVLQWHTAEMARAGLGIAVKPIDPEIPIHVPGFDYPTTYGDIARLPAKKLWARFSTGRAYPDAKTAFLIARAIPHVVTYAVQP